MTTAARPPYRRWALALLGALCVVALSSIVVVDSPAGAAAPGSQELTLGGIQTIEQTFSTTRPALAGLAIRVRPNGPDNSGLQLPLRLRYAGGPPIDIVSQSAPVGAAGDMLTVRFPRPIVPRDPHQITDTLRLILDIPALPPNSGPAIAVLPVAGAQASLLIDGQPQASLALAIIPLYQRRLADAIWPISGMAMGKPGLLGWPPFYALLPYLYLLAIAEGVAALRRARAEQAG